MDEQYAELLVPRAHPQARDAHKVVEAAGAPGAARTRLNAILFLGSVVLTQLSWLGALVYAASRFL